MGSFARQMGKAVASPRTALRLGVSLAHGWWCKIWYPIRGIRFHAGRGLRVTGRLVIRGPGEVRFGKDVTVGMIVTPWTYSPDALIEVGDGCFLNGTRFGCRERITIGTKCILADARVMDTNFHSLHADRHSVSSPVKVVAVVLERNVWVGAAAGILPGTSIGENSVVGFGAVCSGRFPANAVIVGNPARVQGDIPGQASEP